MAGEITQAVNNALEDAQLLPRDLGGVELARRYAALLDANADDPKIVGDLGPKLLATLVALAMAPAGRGEKKGGDSAPVVNKLDELRARREARQRNS